MTTSQLLQIQVYLHQFKHEGDGISGCRFSLFGVNTRFFYLVFLCTMTKISENAKKCGILCLRPPVRVVCLNHKVVVFQPRTGTAPGLGSVANYAFILTLPPHLYQPVFWIFLFLPSILPPPSVSSVCHLIPSLLHPIPTFSPGTNHHPPAWCLHPPPTSLHCLSLYPAPRSCVRRRVLLLYAPHLHISTCYQVPFNPWGVLPSRVPLHLCAPDSPSLNTLTYPVIFWCLVIC